MDVGTLWAGLVKALPTDWDSWLALGEGILANPWARTLALILIVYFTIRVIASIYSGDKQGAELGPVAIREHPSSRYDDNTIRLHRDLMSMNMDGVSANCQVLYVYTDAKGRRRRKVVYREDDIQLSIAPQKIRRADKIDGQEIPDVPTTYVCFPPLETEELPDTISPMQEKAVDYARHHRILENWHDDDSAQIISAAVGVHAAGCVGQGAVHLRVRRQPGRAQGRFAWPSPALQASAKQSSKRRGQLLPQVRILA